MIGFILLLTWLTTWSDSWRVNFLCSWCLIFVHVCSGEVTVVCTDVHGDKWKQTPSVLQYYCNMSGPPCTLNAPWQRFNKSLGSNILTSNISSVCVLMTVLPDMLLQICHICSVGLRSCDCDLIHIISIRMKSFSDPSCPFAGITLWCWGLTAALTKADGRLFLRAVVMSKCFSLGAGNREGSPFRAGRKSRRFSKVFLCQNFKYTQQTLTLSGGAAESIFSLVSIRYWLFHFEWRAKLNSREVNSLLFLYINSTHGSYKSKITTVLVIVSQTDHADVQTAALFVIVATETGSQTTEIK